MQVPFKVTIIYPGGHVTEVAIPIPVDTGVLVRMETIREIMDSIAPQLPRGTNIYLTVKSKANEQQSI
jgi:hypothetical protein